MARLFFYDDKEFTQRKNIFFGYFYANNLVISNNLLTHTHKRDQLNARHARVIYNIKLEKQRAGGEALLFSLYSDNEMILLCNSVLAKAEFYIFLIVFFSLLLSQHYTFINK